MDTRPMLPLLEEQIAYNWFRGLVGQGGMSPGKVPRQEMHEELDAQGLDRVTDRGARHFLLHCWSVMDDERQDYIAQKLETKGK